MSSDAPDDILFQFFSGYVQNGSIAGAWAEGRFMSWHTLSIVAQQASSNTMLAAAWEERLW